MRRIASAQWGHDFRPAYLNLGTRHRSSSANPAVLALTATATPAVREDILMQLGIPARQADRQRIRSAESAL
jgi:superfamily II DNA helicase RecQ